LNYFENVEPSALFKQLSLISVFNSLSIFAQTDGPVAGLDAVRNSVTRLFPTLKQEGLIDASSIHTYTRYGSFTANDTMSVCPSVRSRLCVV
jgi:hypothetical protein